MVAIKGLGMPSCCANCPCSKYEEVRWMEYKFIRCGVTLSKPDKSKNVFWDRETRLDDCPLVEIKENEDENIIN